MRKIIGLYLLFAMLYCKTVYAQPIVVLNDINQIDCDIWISATLTNHDAGSYTYVELWSQDATMFIATIDSIGMPAGIDDQHWVQSSPIPIGITPGNYICVLRMKDFAMQEDESNAMFITITDCTMGVSPYELSDCFMLTNSEGATITLGNEQPAIAALYDLSGKMLLNKEFDYGTTLVRLSGLPAGMYIINVSQGDRKKSFKLFWQ